MGRGGKGEDDRKGEGVSNHTDASGSHVGSNHNGALARLELVEHPIALVLLLVAVDGECWPAVLAKEAGNVVSNALSAREDEDLVGLVVHDLVHVLAHALTLLEVGADLDDLGDSDISMEVVGANVNLDEVVLVV